MIPRPIRTIASLATLAVAAACSRLARRLHRPALAVAAAPPSQAAAVRGPLRGGRRRATARRPSRRRCPPARPATVTIETEPGRDRRSTIEADLSPIAAGNFVALAECGYYDGVVFHRLVPGFVIQGGDPTAARGDAAGPATPSRTSR